MGLRILKNNTRGRGNSPAVGVSVQLRQTKLREMEANNSLLVQRAFLSDYSHLKAEHSHERRGKRGEQWEGCSGIHHYTTSLALHRQPNKDSAVHCLHASVSAYFLFYIHTLKNAVYAPFKDNLSYQISREPRQRWRTHAHGNILAQILHTIKRYTLTEYTLHNRAET